MPAWTIIWLLAHNRHRRISHLAPIYSTVWLSKDWTTNGAKQLIASSDTRKYCRCNYGLEIYGVRRTWLWEVVFVICVKWNHCKLYDNIFFIDNRHEAFAKVSYHLRSSLNHHWRIVKMYCVQNVFSVTRSRRLRANLCFSDIGLSSRVR